MDEDIFPVLCPKKIYTKRCKNLKTATSESNNMEKTSRRAGKVHDPGVPLSTKVAVEYLLSGKLKTSVCRYCLKITVGLSELDQIMQIAGRGVMYKVSIREMIACFYPFKARQEESFPEKICQRCIDRAINAYLFTQQCEQAGRALHNWFDDINEKFNKLDPVDRKKKRGRQKLNPNPNTIYAEHHKVMDYAEPLRNIINLQTESLSNEPNWNEFECKKCWQVFPNLESLLNHEQVHPKYMWYHCRLCGKSFVKLNQLKKHFNQVHIRRKGVMEEVEKTFKCQECGNVTENYIQHLQHIEKHKFKSVMKLLIEKKTDQLCLVCLKKSTDLVDLEKTVCIHGSCPELVGDKSLHTVLASTLPDQKSYKYQELHVPRKADIMTITKRKRKYMETQNIPHIIPEIKFKLSLPNILTKNKFKTDDFYYYVFCEPQTEDNNIKTFVQNIDTQDTTGPRIYEITDEENMDCQLDNKIPTRNEGIQVIDNSTGYKIPGDVKELVNIAGYYKPVSEMVVEETEQLDSYINVVKNDTNQKELLENENPGSKNVTSHIDSVDVIVNDNASVKTDVVDNIINVKDPMDVVGIFGPEKDFVFTIDENKLPVLSEQNNLFNQNEFYTIPKFIFSYPITLEFNHNTNDDMKTKITFSNHENVGTSSNREADNIKEYEEVYNPKHDIRPIKVKTDLSFTNASENKELFENNQITDNVANVLAETKIKSDDCKLCWLFKHLNKCEYCKKPIDTSVQVTEENKQNTENNTGIDNKSNANTDKPVDAATFFDKYVEVQPKQMKIGMYSKERNIEKNWQCNVCLTNNNKDRSTCHCCESKKYIENNNCKVTFGNNKTFLYKTHEKGNKMEKEVDISFQETKPFIVIDEATMIDTKTGTVQENFEIQMDNNRDKNSIYNMDIETDTFNYTSDTINEEMDVEEESFIPNTVQKLDPVPILAANIVLYAGTNIQFNVGSNSIQNEKGARKFKRAVRNIPKAFHK